MGLVAGALQQLQGRAPPRQRERLHATRQENFLLALREADDRELLLTDRTGGVQRRAEPTLPAVDDQQVGQRLLLGEPPREVTGQLGAALDAARSVGQE